MDTRMSGKKQSSEFARQKDKVVTDISGMVSDARDLAKTVAARSTAPIAAARTRVAARLAETKAAATEKAKHAAQATDGYVRHNPWKVIGVAAAAGLIVGLSLYAREHRHHLAKE